MPARTHSRASTSAASWRTLSTTTGTTRIPTRQRPCSAGGVLVQQPVRRRVLGKLHARAGPTGLHAARRLAVVHKLSLDPPPRGPWHAMHAWDANLSRSGAGALSVRLCTPDYALDRGAPPANPVATCGLDGGHGADRLRVEGSRPPLKLSQADQGRVVKLAPGQRAVVRLNQPEWAFAPSRAERSARCNRHDSCSSTRAARPCRRAADVTLTVKALARRRSAIVATRGISRRGLQVPAVAAEVRPDRRGSVSVRRGAEVSGASDGLSSTGRARMPSGRSASVRRPAA